MDIKTYEMLTGKVIPANKKTYFDAQIRRIQTKLENLLGYTLAPQNLYTELGKTQQDCSCSEVPEPGSLLLPDAVRGIYKVFPYNWKDLYLRVDPFYHVYQAKLVRVQQNSQFVTYKTFDNIRQEFMRDGIGVTIERCENCFCDCNCKDCVQLAVDADWVDFSKEGRSVPNDLLYLLCDMLDWYTDDKLNYTSESVTGHSWSKASNLVAPEKSEDALILLKRYAGPFGQVNRIPVI